MAKMIESERWWNDRGGGGYDDGDDNNYDANLR
jgi:hypothetical protein